MFPPIHVVDFEGTRESGILEFGVATIRDGMIESVRTRLCGPAGAIRESDRRLHGLSRDSLEGNAPFRDEWSSFAALRQAGPFCAHNAAVEDGLIRAVWPHPRSSPTFARPGQMDARWGPWLDTLHLYRGLYPGLESHNLHALVDTFDLAGALEEAAARFCPPARSRYHCALYDALASALLLARLLGDPALEGHPLSWWLARSAPSRTARQGLEQDELF